MFEFVSDSTIDLTTYFFSMGALLFASFTSLFSVVNPIAAVPVFLTLTGSDFVKDRNHTARMASIYMFFVLIVFLLVGTYILSFFGISLAGVRIAGGIIIMRAAFSMLNPDKSGRKLTDEDEAAAMEKEDISFSPLAMPLLSGPGSIAVVIGFASQATNMTDYVINGISIVLVALCAFGMLRLAPIMVRYIGPTGMNVMTRMMGFIALSISVQFILSGISRYFGIGV
jgi:multiple antibiotic resistance protein